jgi:hypothetical protein
MKLRESFSLVVLLALTVACGSSGGALGGGGGPDTFLTSDDYRDGEEIVGKLLTDEEYGRMVEDIARRGGEMNWGWVHADGRPAKPGELLFDVGSYRTVRLAPVENVSLVVLPGLEEDTHEAFRQGLEQLGLQVVEQGDADLAMDLAIVDLKTDKTFIWVATLDPFVEIEGRLAETATGQPLLLFRHQEHGTTPSTAAADTVGEVLKFLR